MSIFHPPINRRLFRYSDGKRSIALISTMALVAIVSLMLVAFVTAMRQDRAATYSYSQSLATEQVARGGLQLIVSELKRELARDLLPDYGTGNYTNNPIFTNLATANIMPQANVTNTAIPTLVKISSSTPFFTGNLSQSQLRASTLSSTTPSINGRAISLARWGRPYFGNFTTTASAPYWVYMTRGGVTNALGISVSTSGNTNSLNNRLASNTNYAIGRFAYAIYDQGGLLDITVAGHRNNLTALEYNQLKGTLAGADLRVITNGAGVQLIDPDALVAWRNKTTGVSAAAYLTYVTNFASTNGFRKVYPGDTTFLSRQDLIKAALNNSAGFNTNALPVLTTFTREKNAPSWGPNTNVGGAYNYATLSLNPSSTNRLTTLVRYTATSSGTHYRSDGTSYSYNIKPGDPAVRTRFPLDRLKWLTPNGPAAGISDAAIQACFGLKWAHPQAFSPSGISSAYVWQYVGNSGSSEQSSIKTLDTVASESREPNFFELLQAGILTGSLGLDTGVNPSVSSSFASYFPSGYQKSSMLQILRIGACIIDQYDSDSYPTIIEYREPSKTNWQAIGVESLPYLNVWKDLVAASPDNPASAVGAYIAVGLWNPHQNPPVANYPAVRVRVQGTIGILSWWGTTTTSIPAAAWASKNEATTYSYGYAADGGIHTVELNANGIKGFLNPGILTTSTVISPPSAPGTAFNWATTPMLGGIASGGTSPSQPPYVAYRIKDLPLDTTKVPTSNELNTTTSVFYQYGGVPSTIISTDITSPFQIMLEYQQPSAAGNTWIPYNYFSGINDMNYWQGGANYGAPRNNNIHNHPLWTNTLSPPAVSGKTFMAYDTWANGATVSTQVSDPRSLRPTNFEFYRSTHGGANTPGNYAGLQPLWTSTLSDNKFLSSGYGGSHLSPAANPSLFGNREITQAPIAYGKSYYPATLIYNTGINIDTGAGLGPYDGNSVCADPDGVIRMADYGLFSKSSSVGNPWQRVQDRPVILNRAFQSIAELGYVLRDGPWKTLDLFSPNSPDAGLLDLFCLSESSKDVVAGRVNLNTQNKLVLQAILSGIVTDNSNSTVLSNPASIAQNLVNYTSLVNAAPKGPISNKSDLIAKFIGDTTALPASSFGSTDEANTKTRRESVARALFDVGQTRTWNLLIDIVTQTGKYPPNATTMDQFMVDGERRYWLHIAIDRITGEIVDQQLETVIE